ncbi:MAG: hypothetical protein KKI14_02030, partial [Nanoarchaeota archaeon]|nr:hypothetical protein [Nanoarchaeota archaeon]
DTISDEDLLVDITKTEIEKQLLNSKKENEIMKERLRLLEKQMKTIAELMKQSVNKGEMIFRLE